MADWPQGGGEMSGRIRTYDWATTALGPVEGWLQSQKTAVDVMLASGHPMQLVWGAQHIFLYNDAHVPLLGNRHPGALGIPLSEAWPDVWACIGPLVERVFAGETINYKGMPLVMKRSGGLEDTWWDLSCSPIRNESGAVAGLLNLAVEATGEAVLARELANTRQLQEVSSLLIAEQNAEVLYGRILDAAMAIMHADCASIQILDPERQELHLVGHRNFHPWSAAYWERIPDSAGTVCGSALHEGERIFVSDASVFNPADSEAYRLSGIRSVQSTPLAARDGRLIGMISTHWRTVIAPPAEEDFRSLDVLARQTADAVEHARTAKAMHDTEELLRQFGEASQDVLWVRDAATLQWQYLSPAFETIYGLDRQEALSGDNYRNWQDLIVPEDRVLAVERIGQAVRGEQVVFEYRVRRPVDGALRWLRNTDFPMRGSDGRIKCIGGVGHDITAMKEAEEALARAGEELERRVAERTAELQRALDTLHRETVEHEHAEERLRQSEKLKAVGQLTGGIAHDFNNMLQGISSALALVRTRLAQGRVADAAAYIEPAAKAASRAGALTHRLLAFSRQQTLTPELVNMDQLAQGMADMIRRTVGPAVQVELKLADGHWMVLCDPNQLESALLNLCVNARDAMPNGGWLTISTEERTLSTEDVAGHEDLQPGGYATLAVTDTGTGMTPDVAARVFEPFFTTKPLGRGTGLGLSQIYGFIRQSGGMVQIETAPGKGTTVRLCLPFYELNPKTRFAPPANGKTLLLVEDEHDVRGLLADQLRDLGYRVLEADTAEAALRALATGVKIDLMVTDVGLRGGTDGRQLAEAARGKVARLPVLFITGFATIEMLDGLDVLRKPFDTATLASLIEERLSAASDA